MTGTTRNERIRALRYARGWTQQQAAEAIAAAVSQSTGRGSPTGIDAQWVGRIERGERRWPNADYRAAMRAVYQVATDAELGLSGVRSKSPAETTPSTAPVPLDGTFRLLPMGRAALHQGGADAAAMQAFRAADLHVGGGHLYASVLQYLQRDVAPKIFGAEEGADNNAVFTAAAAHSWPKTGPTRHVRWREKCWTPHGISARSSSFNNSWN